MYVQQESYDRHITTYKYSKLIGPNVVHINTDK